MARYLIVGAGIVGSAIAERLTALGEDVLVVASGPGDATTASFGWINASFYHDEAHFRLRRASLLAWERLHIGPFCGTLFWEGDVEAQAVELQALGTYVEIRSREELWQLEPNLRAVPSTVLRIPGETVVDAGAVARRLLNTACAKGAKGVFGQRVRSILIDERRAVGVETDAGIFLADRVVLAAGGGASELLSPLGINLPMLRRPADMLVTRPTERLLSHVLVTGEREIKQDDEGRFWVPSSPAHQEITGEPEAFNLEAVAQASMAVLKRHLPVGDLDWERVVRAERPVPGDGLPVVGATGIEGLDLAVMHSGVTLAPIVAQLLVDEMRGGGSNEAGALLEPYRLARFESVE